MPRINPQEVTALVSRLECCWRIPAGSDPEKAGDLEALAISARKDDSLKLLQKSVGGYIEVVPILDGGDAALIVNEDGLSKGLSVNDVASRIAQRTIVGDCVYIPDIVRWNNELHDEED